MAVQPPVVLYWGDDEFILRLAALEHLESRGVKAVEVDGRDWQGGETSDLATPSLWGERRALLIIGCQGLSEAGAKEVTDYVGSPSPDAVCVLTLLSRAKSLPKLGKAVEAGGGATKQLTLRRQELPSWIMDRARKRGAAISSPAAGALVNILGEEPAVLDQAVEQLASAFPGASIGPDEVKSQFRGLGEGRVWDLCDQAFMGRLPEALRTLRSMLDARDDPLLILGGIAARVRDLLRVQSLPDNMRSGDAAKAAGLRFDWQLRRYREQAAKLTPEQLSAIHEQVVEADRALKGGAPGDVILSALVAQMAGREEARLDLDLRVSR